MAFLSTFPVVCMCILTIKEIKMNKLNVKLVLKLKEAGLNRTEIAKSRHISRKDVNFIFKVANENKITLASVANKSEDEIYWMFYPGRRIPAEQIYALPNYEWVHLELKKVGVTLKLLWEEYSAEEISKGNIPVKYTKFCNDYSDFINKCELVSHIEHKPGYECEVDWAGKPMYFNNGSKNIPVYLFVGTLPYSRYSYVEATLDMKQDTWLRCHVNMYAFFKGVPRRTICDNLKTGVIKHPHEGDVVLNEAYEALGYYYNTAILPARVRRPRDKATAEGVVGDITTSIIAKCRNMNFLSLAQLQDAVKVKLNEYNDTPFQKREGTRTSIWKEVEQLSLQNLPIVPYEIPERKLNVKVCPDSHIVFKNNHYSVSYRLRGEFVTVSATSTTVKIYFQNELIASHPRFADTDRNKYSTHKEDLPPELNKPRFDKQRLIDWASNTGPNTLKVVEKIFDSVSFEEQGYNSALSVLNLSSKYGKNLLERACSIALSRVSTPRYGQLKPIIQSLEGKSANNDLMPPQDKTQPSDSDVHLRGADYYKNLIESQQNNVNEGNSTLSDEEQLNG